jgi:mRNA interferase MazF
MVSGFWGRRTFPLTTASYNETNPFAVKFIGPKGVVSYILSHQPKSFD